MNRFFIKTTLIMITFTLCIIIPFSTSDAEETWVEKHDRIIQSIENELSEKVERNLQDKSEDEYYIDSIDIHDSIDKYLIFNTPFMIYLYMQNKDENDFLLDYCVADKSIKFPFEAWYMPGITKNGKRCLITFNIEDDKVKTGSIMYGDDYDKKPLYYSEIVELISKNADINNVKDVKVCNTYSKYAMTMIIITMFDDSKYVIPYQWTGSLTIDYMGLEEYKMYKLDYFMEKMEETFKEITIEEGKENLKESRENPRFDSGNWNNKNPSKEFLKDPQIAEDIMNNDKDNINNKYYYIVIILFGVVILIVIFTIIIKKKQSKS